MSADPQLIIDIYNIFLPDEPLPPGDPLYVNCEELRGDSNIEQQLGRKIIRANTPTCQLYTGHTGSGKSTELLRLKKYLSDRKCFVVYFSADEEDIDSEDTQYSDILLACTRHLLQEIKNTNPDPILHWLKDRWQGLKELGLTKVELQDLSLETAIPTFSKITANLRTEPTQRAKIRQLVQPHTITLIKALNEFISEAKSQLSKDKTKTKLVIIVDSLEKITPTIQEDNRTNHEHIFIDRSQQLKGLDCHLIYTVPISLRYSNRAPDLFNLYGDIPVLPVIKIKDINSNIPSEAGLNKLKEILNQRVAYVKNDLNLATDIFENEEILERLCSMSGGHVRHLIQLMQAALNEIDELPITKKAAQRSIGVLKSIYRIAIREEQWLILKEVASNNKILSSDKYQDLLLNRSLLEYITLNEQGEAEIWHDVHPVVKELTEFNQ